MVVLRQTLSFSVSLERLKCAGSSAIWLSVIKMKQQEDFQDEHPFMLRVSERFFFSENSLKPHTVGLAMLNSIYSM